MEARSVSPWRFDPSSSSWTISAGMSSLPPGSDLTLATFNVWFDDYEREARCDALLRLLQQCGADIIALQEITHHVHRQILQHPWVRQEFAVSDATGASFSDYGVLLLSRLPVLGFEFHDLPTTMSRKLLLGRVKTGAGDLAVCSLHLESLQEFGLYREEQLEEIFRILEPEENAILLGDFNFCSSWEENRRIDERYSDLWPLLHPDDPGWTVDGEANAMRRALGKSGKQVRFDRILVRSDQRAFRLRSMRLLGQDPITPDQPDLLISDHFGLAATLHVDRPH
jgi:tyrosyl-DNA phosphodiesterase 2